MRFEVALAAEATIGESATWIADENALYWIDVKAPALHRLHLEDGATRSWTLGSDVGAFCLTADGGAVVALRQGVFHLDLASGEQRLLAPPPFDPALFRFNEGGVDPAGRFWVGVMFDPLEPGPERRPGRLHSFTLADGLRAEDDTAVLHNGMAWSADARSFWLSHSYERTIFRFAFDPETSRLGAREVFARVGEADGIPDGAAVDAEGGYWSALHGAGRLRRLHPDGSLDRDHALPVSQPTMPAFAGDDLCTLFVTSAAEKTSGSDEPCAGALFRAATALAGLPRRAHIAD